MDCNPMRQIWATGGATQEVVFPFITLKSLTHRPKSNLFTRFLAEASFLPTPSSNSFSHPSSQSALASQSRNVSFPQPFQPHPSSSPLITDPTHAPPQNGVHGLHFAPLKGLRLEISATGT
nr:hypothetical protein Itr_chr06CG23390 [Ipomoea trifida]